MLKKKIAVLSGAGISAESGIATFRDANGLWEGHDVMEVASPEGWDKNPALVLDFYNKRREVVLSAQPNAGHKAIAELEEHFEVAVITQNIDDLHERAGSTNVLHLHGSILEARSSEDESKIYPVENGKIAIGDLCEEGAQLRPNIVWFGERVPAIDEAVSYFLEADIILVVGTSLAVYPAAGLINYAKRESAIYVIDPNTPPTLWKDNVKRIEEASAKALPKLKEQLIEDLASTTS